MLTTKYTFPLPNNGDSYSFSEKELIKLLDSVYDKGFEDGVSVTNISETTCASANTECTIIYDRDASINHLKVVKARKRRNNI